MTRLEFNGSFQRVERAGPVDRVIGKLSLGYLGLARVVTYDGFYNRFDRKYYRNTQDATKSPLFKTKGFDLRMVRRNNPDKGPWRLVRN